MDHLQSSFESLFPGVARTCGDENAGSVSSKKAFSISDTAKSGNNLPERQKKYQELLLEFGTYFIKVNAQVKVQQVFGSEKLQGQIVAAFLNSDLEETLKWRAFLLAGVHGTGKSSFLMAAARKASILLDEEIFVLPVRAGNLLSKWVGEGPLRVQALFEVANKKPRSSIYIDEADGLLMTRSDDDTEGSRVFKNTLLSELQGVNVISSTILICSTNKPWDIDQAFLRRFNGIHCILLPTQNERTDIFKKFLANLALTREVDFTTVDISALAAKTDGYSGDDIRKVVMNTGNTSTKIKFNNVEYKIEEIPDSVYEEMASSGKAAKKVLAQIGQEDLEHSFGKSTRSVKPADMQVMKKWQRENLKSRYIPPKNTEDKEKPKTPSEGRETISRASLSACCNTC